MSRKDLEIGDIFAVRDAKEQAPLDLLLPTVDGSLYTGDYSIKNLEHLICIERKSFPDAISCCGRERDRFERCIQRMRGYEVRVLVIEATWGMIELGQWRSQLKPTQVKAALYSWMKHVSVVLAGDRTTAANIVSGILFSAARDRWRQLSSFHAHLKIATPADDAKKPKDNTDLTA